MITKPGNNASRLNIKTLANRNGVEPLLAALQAAALPLELPVHFFVVPVRLERTTPALKERCYHQLSYGTLYGNLVAGAGFEPAQFKVKV